MYVIEPYLSSYPRVSTRLMQSYFDIAELLEVSYSSLLPCSAKICSETHVQSGERLTLLQTAALYPFYKFFSIVKHGLATLLTPVLGYTVPLSPWLHCDP